MDVEEMLARATAELESAEADYRAAQQRVNELRTMQDGMRLALERYGPGQTGAPPAVPGAHAASLKDAPGLGEQAEPSMRDAVHEVLTAPDASAELPRQTAAHEAVPAARGPAEPPTQNMPHSSVPAARKTSRSSRRPKRRSPGRSKPEVPQTDRCYTALTEAGGAASTTEIRERLMRDGHNYDPEQVRSAIAYLKRKGRVVSVQPGVWAVAPGPTVAAQNGTAVPNGTTY